MELESSKWFGASRMIMPLARNTKLCLELWVTESTHKEWSLKSHRNQTLDSTTVLPEVTVNPQGKGYPPMYPSNITRLKHVPVRGTTENVAMVLQKDCCEWCINIPARSNYIKRIIPQK